MLAESDAEGFLRRLNFVEPHDGGPGEVASVSPPVSELAKQMEEYFSGRRQDFEIPLRPEGTEFQQRVWEELRRIPYGETISYLDLARRLGDPDAVRAVARANALNPIAILIPCHRVIGKDGSLTGYAGGLGRKSFLLSLEAGVKPSAGRQLGLFAP